MLYKKIALIPAYKPDNNLTRITKELAVLKMEVIIVDDGSGEEYKDIFNSCEKFAKIISHIKNEGKGSAIKTGLKYIKENYTEPYVIVTMDCDGQHTVDDAMKLIKNVNNKESILVIGKRLRGNNTPFRSKIGNSITRFVYKMTTRLDIYDTQSGLRAFNDSLIDYLIKIQGNRFEYEMNVLLNCAKDKIRIKEVDITTIYINNNSESHFDAIKDSFRIYKIIFEFLLSRK